MTIPSPEHLFEQAKKLIERPGKGAPRQVDIRRAISSAYYGVFHFVLHEVANQFIGVALAGSALHVLAYRSVDHGKLADLCHKARRSPLPSKISRYVPSGSFNKQVKDFAAFFVELKEKRESADYDPSLKFNTKDAALLIAIAESAVDRFKAAPVDERRAFLALLAFSPR